ncbi:MAG: T9SS type A sorting domain-containing protein [Paludibacteraceae bacterium]|nr:T9SS type A sorting domain-containing protein [Paludibacteraceae bacterium]
MKRFYNNTINSLALKNALRVFALLCVLLGFSSSAWGQSFGIIGGGNLNLPSNVGDIKGMSQNGSTYTYTITTKGTSDWFRIYKLPINDSNQNASCLYSSTENVALDTEISCSVGQYREFKLSNLENGGTYTFTLVYTSDTNIKLTVTSLQEDPNCVLYFDNTIGWSNVYAYHSIYWDEVNDNDGDKGAGAKGRHYAKMEPTGCGNVWKAVFGAPIQGHIAFSSDDEHDHDNFYNTKDGIFCSANNVNWTIGAPLYIPNKSNVEYKNQTPYYFQGSWSTYNITPTATQIILDISKHTDWKTSDAEFKAILYNGSDVVNTYDLTQCPYDNNIYFTESGLVLSNCTHVEMQRWNKDYSKKWNTSGKLELTCDNNCVEINDWENSAEITKYEGECADVKDLLLLSREANIDTSNKTATLYGYLKFTDCDAQITEYGFYYCPSDGCIPTENSKVVLQAQHQGAGIERGTEFSAVLNYTEGVRYGYRSYAVVNGKVRLSKEVRYFGSSQCNPQPAGQPINVTVDGAQYGIDYADNCNLIYGNLQLALDNLESHEKEYIVDGALQQDITITVFQLDNKGTYTGKTKTVSGGTGGGTRSLNVNVIEDINKNQNDNYKLTIKAAEGHNPRIQHLLIRESRNIEIDGLNIISNPTNNGETEDTALEIDAGKCSDWVNVSRELENANILIKNCMIGSNGFTGVHATGCSGISFENNTFNLIVNVPENKDDAEYSNIVGWGASAKFFACKNIKFVRNNFMGAHPTLVWLQQSSNALFYNNVFWNTNEFVGECVAVRLVNQWGNNSVGNIAFFYNTFYLADNDNNKNYDFLRYKIDVASAFDESSVYFQYNNCYSYDTDIPGKASSGNSFVDGEYCPNNYWSIKADAKFDIKDCGDDTKNINVSNYVCETSASGPASLIIKQPADPNDAGLKVGTPLKLTDITNAVGEEIPFTADDLTDDRYNENIRKENAWTLGAYEQSASNNVETIYWVGGVDKYWDNRNNWVRIDEYGQARRLTCVDYLSTELKIVIPQENSTQYPISTTGKYFYPEIPASFDATERENTTIGLVSETKGIPASEQVSAGVGYPGDPAKYAKTIELEYGAALKGVHRLVDGETRLYDNAISHLTVGRDEWTLVGTIVKPADGNGGYRFITSNDYFCNYTPQVYMHRAEIVQEGEFTNATWGDTFADLDKGVEPTTVYAINVPDQYGKYKAPSRIYYKGLAGGTDEPDKLQDGVKPHSFGPFTGRFVNESSMPTYGTGVNNKENLSSGTAYLFNNSYPCNIDPEEIQKSGLGNIMCYDYDGGAFVSIDARAVESTLKPQHGFIFIPASNGTLTIDENWLVDGETKSRSAQYEEPIFSIQLDNAEYGLHGYSNLVVKRDELLADNEDSPLNVRKVIAPNENTPEIYAIAFDEELARVCVNNMNKTIPLGIYLHKPMSVKFSKCYSKNILSAILVDTYTNKEYDLMDRSFTTETLANGNLDGRFFLNLTTLDEDYYVEDEEDDDNVSTDVEENTLDENAINIFVRESDNAIRVLTSGVELREIYVSDMSGRTMRYNVNGYSASIKLPVPNGVYLVQVIGDKLTRTEKVILK